MLQGQSILCFAPDPWNDIWRNRHQIMSLLSERNTVLYVEPRPYLRPVLAEMRRGRLGPGGPLLRRINPGLCVYRPSRLAPLSGHRLLGPVTAAWRDASLRRIMRQLQMQRPILWLFRPDMADLPGRYGEQFLIYHIVDEYTGYADMDADGGDARLAGIRRREQELIARADLVLVTSQTLLATKGGLNPRTYCVPNAADYDAFAAAAQVGWEPPELRDVPRPRIGYVGAVNDKLDADLLYRVAQAYPKASMLMVGPERPASAEMRRGLERLKALDNVFMPGAVPVERVPEFVAACDVGLLPYKQNAWTKAIHPLKLYEYLACGLPVVAVDIPSVHEEAAVIAIAPDADAFVAAVGRALADDGPLQRAARQARAAQNTWRHRVERISELIEAGLAQGSPRG